MAKGKAAEWRKKSRKRSSTQKGVEEQYQEMDQSFPDSKAMCLDFSCRLYRSRKARRLGKRSWMTLSSSIKCRIPWGKEDVLFAKIEADHQQVKPFFMTFYIAPVEGEKSISGFLRYMWYYPARDPTHNERIEMFSMKWLFLAIEIYWDSIHLL